MEHADDPASSTTSSGTEIQPGTWSRRSTKPSAVPDQTSTSSCRRTPSRRTRGRYPAATARVRAPARRSRSVGDRVDVGRRTRTSACRCGRRRSSAGGRSAGRTDVGRPTPVASVGREVESALPDRVPARTRGTRARTRRHADRRSAPVVGGDADRGQRRVDDRLDRRHAAPVRPGDEDQQPEPFAGSRSSTPSGSSLGSIGRAACSVLAPAPGRAGRRRRGDEPGGQAGLSELWTRLAAAVTPARTRRIEVRRRSASSTTVQRRTPSTVCSLTSRSPIGPTPSSGSSAARRRRRTRAGCGTRRAEPRAWISRWRPSDPGRAAASQQERLRGDGDRVEPADDRAGGRCRAGRASRARAGRARRCRDATSAAGTRPTTGAGQRGRDRQSRDVIGAFGRLTRLGSSNGVDRTVPRCSRWRSTRPVSPATSTDGWTQRVPRSRAAQLDEQQRDTTARGTPAPMTNSSMTPNTRPTTIATTPATTRATPLAGQHGPSSSGDRTGTASKTSRIASSAERWAPRSARTRMRWRARRGRPP